tara:strand:+ start:11930 stop:12847 length:918 start_codon:yes stop_codon:yes gene_type:complete
VNKVIIYGSGFGLYGYLPSIAKKDNIEIFLDARYRDKLNTRKELEEYANKICWYDDEIYAVNKIDTAVLALRPKDQDSKIRYLLDKSNIKNYLLEKPLSIDPHQSIELLNLLKEKKVNFSIGYLFQYTSWGKDLITLSKKSIDDYFLKWKFHAHHFTYEVESWKREDDQGGGIIRFYGIQLIALLSQIKFSNLLESKITYKDSNSYRWEAKFSNENKSTFALELNSLSPKKEFSISRFRSKKSNELVCNLEDPFENIENSKSDRRVKFISDSLNNLRQSKSFFTLNEDVINLWREIEQNSKIISE